MRTLCALAILCLLVIPFLQTYILTSQPQKSFITILLNFPQGISVNITKCKERSLYTRYEDNKLVIMLTEVFYNDTKTPMLNVLLKDARYAYTEIIACRENISALSLRELRKYVENITEKRIGLRAAYNDNPITVEINVTKDELSIRIISRFRNLELEKDILDKLLALNIEKIEII
ncbi:MAG: hypothetical protein DRJ64_01155, partial [Thermoprotei archaeon]